MSNQNVVLRLLLNVPTEEPAYVDVEFDSPEQVMAAMDALLAGSGLIGLRGAGETPILVRVEHLVAAFPVEYDSDELDDEE